MKVISAIHNHFIQKIRKRIWLPRSYDKSKWEDAMNITHKLKLSRPSNLPKSTYLPFSTLPPPTLSDAARDSDVDYLKNSMKYALAGWCVDFNNGRIVRWFVCIVASS
ncbi:hypothetical protein GLOIN_2v1785553 [Rhizophagus irregularis DAOM 181602=DAOM 197198]|nr:hypothetical protein GLOIN_2v1785553 [Rhizophagus irregularis DAOM 181602=DAOM 197198]